MVLAEETNAPPSRRSSSAKGLELPFDMMQDLLSFEYAVSLPDGGIALRGSLKQQPIALVPERYDGNTVQWHLIKCKDGLGHIPTEGLIFDRSTSLKDLRWLR